MNALSPEPGGYTQLLSPAFVRSLPWDEGRGTVAMGWIILSEAMIFVALFFSYFYYAQHSGAWPLHPLPSLQAPLLITAVLGLSCAVLAWGQHRLAAGGRGGARIALFIALLCGAAYIGLEAWSFQQYLPVVTPQQDTYGSIYYTILAVHGLHQVVGMLLLAYALLLPLEPTSAPPHRPYFNSALYWYFCCFVWLVVLAYMYLLPHMQR